MSTALVLGLGDSGLAMARWLAGAGHDVRVSDTRVAPPRLEDLRREVPTSEFVGGDWLPTLLDGVDLLALSPGLSPERKPLSSILAEARKRKLDIVGEIELFARELAHLATERGYRPQVIGVTGTNGKTTTTRLTGLLVERSGRRVAVAGNIGPTALDELRARLAAEDLPEVWVLELSSFQLASTVSLQCDAAAVLNITQDHLDWHGSMDAYAAAKQRIFAKGTVQVLNRDDPRVMAMARKGARVITVGSDAPNVHDSFGLLDTGGMTWLAAIDASEAPQRRRRAVADTELAVEIPPARYLMPADALLIRGRHNALNALVALALARAIDCPLAPMLHALREYRGEPHRVEPICVLQGVEYFDDSKGTNVGASVAALDGLGGEGRKLVVILGGDGKGQDFAPLAPAVGRHARAAVLIGRDAGAVRAALAAGAPGVPLFNAATLEEAVQRASEMAQPGDAVLLSPACASLDMFRDYKHRAQVFVDTVHELAAEAGQPC